MIDLTLSQWLAVSAIVFAASVLRGLVGFGFAVATVSLFGLVLAPADAVLLSVLLQVAIGTKEGPAAARACDWPALRPLLLGAMGATPIGLLALHLLSPSAARALLAVISIAVLAVISRPSLALCFQTGMPPLAVGGVAGILNGLAAMPGPPVVAYFISSGATPVASRASLVVFFAVAAIFAALNALLAGLLDLRLLVVAASALPALLGGSLLGARLFTLASARAYRTLALIVLTASVAVAVWKSLADFRLS